MQRGGTTTYYEQDGVGSVTSLTNSAGALAQTYTYDSFGNTTNSSGSLQNFFRYTGREFDPETSLYYYRARYYDPTTGRFLSEDPIHFHAGTNFYRYVNNNPVLLLDPMGTCPASQPPPSSPNSNQNLCDAVSGVLSYAGVAVIPIEAVPNPVGAGLAILSVIVYFSCL
jgi:RHS repeat-associated protein